MVDVGAGNLLLMLNVDWFQPFKRGPGGSRANKNSCFGANTWNMFDLQATTVVGRSI